MTKASVLLLAAQVFFFWMFLSAEPLESLADAGMISGSGYEDTHAASYLFTARWRHGMTPGWWLYMPGFFAVAITAWFWALGTLLASFNSFTAPTVKRVHLAIQAAGGIAAITSALAGIGWWYPFALPQPSPHTD